jgi:uncharacterized protein YndB with AHSA1/START domain
MARRQQSDDKLVIRRRIAASSEAVFAAWTDPESIRHWMCPGDCVTAEAQLDLRVGGSFRIVMKSPIRDVEHTGRYEVVEPPRRLVFTWVSKNTDYQPTRVTVDITDVGEGCELVLTHEQLPTLEAVDAHRGGWGQIVDKLAGHLTRQAGGGRGC